MNKQQITNKINELQKQLKKIELKETQKKEKPIIIKTKTHEFQIYKWDKHFKDFPMPKGFAWCKYSLFVDLINDKKIELEGYPVVYYTENQFKQNIKNGYSLSRLFLSKYLNLYSYDDGGLANSLDNGRVCIMRKIK